MCWHGIAINPIGAACGFSKSHMDKKEKITLKERDAGILMHITSLLGPAYIGDIGSLRQSICRIFIYKQSILLAVAAPTAN